MGTRVHLWAAAALAAAALSGPAISASDDGAEPVAAETTLDMATLRPRDGFVILGDRSGGNTGLSIAAAGDVNGDGFADLIIGAPYENGPDGQGGAAYVIFGKAAGFGAPVAGRRVIDLANLSPREGFVIRGPRRGVYHPWAGFSVAGIGDFNGDGFDDVLIGAPNNREAYVVYGRARGFGAPEEGRRVIELGSLRPRDGFVIRSRYHSFGSSVAAAGDVNGNGLADLIIGAPQETAGGYNGRAYVIFGRARGLGSRAADGRRVFETANLGPARGFLIQGTAEMAGRSVAGAGDMNGDGFDDVIVGAPWNSESAWRMGAAYVVFGRARGFGTLQEGRRVVDLATLGPRQGFVIRGMVQSQGEAGTSVAGAGDVNGDGLADVALSAPRGEGGRGAAYVVFGRDRNFGTLEGGRRVVDLAALGPRAGVVIRGALPGSSGEAGVALGDVNGDGLADVIVGAPRETPSGTVHAVYGQAGLMGRGEGGRRIVDLDGLAQDAGFGMVNSAYTNPATEGMGRTNALGAADINGDGRADVLIGAFGHHDRPYGTGGGYVVFGR